ncbi:hypothetical protein ABZP36_006521, partial [Zizania latifolia]
MKARIHRREQQRQGCSRAGGVSIGGTDAPAPEAKRGLTPAPRRSGRKLPGEGERERGLGEIRPRESCPLLAQKLCPTRTAAPREKNSARTAEGADAKKESFPAH